VGVLLVCKRLKLLIDPETDGERERVAALHMILTHSLFLVPANYFSFLILVVVILIFYLRFYFSALFFF